MIKKDTKKGPKKESSKLENIEEQVKQIKDLVRESMLLDEIEKVQEKVTKDVVSEPQKVPKECADKTKEAAEESKKINNQKLGEELPSVASVHQTEKEKREELPSVAPVNQPEKGEMIQKLDDEKPLKEFILQSEQELPERREEKSILEQEDLVISPIKEEIIPIKEEILPVREGILPIKEEKLPAKETLRRSKYEIKIEDVTEKAKKKLEAAKAKTSNIKNRGLSYASETVDQVKGYFSNILNRARDMLHESHEEPIPQKLEKTIQSVADRVKDVLGVRYNEPTWNVTFPEKLERSIQNVADRVKDIAGVQPEAEWDLGEEDDIIY